ncbi:hypothetical protein EV174_003489 [Coemansia sp. RSA 2320]|nr:hypothetical protein EV174_003489 [Coemansia sp. RSA 2320]
MTPQTQGRGGSKRGEAAMRRFREMHYLRFRLGTRSNIHGACLLRSQLPVRLPRPHTMQLIYEYPPPGVGFRRFSASAWQEEARDQASFGQLASEHEAAVRAQIVSERARTAQWLRSNKAAARTHAVVATQSGLHFFVAGFGYWNILDINLNLVSESCVGVKAFETWATIEEEGENDGKEAALPVLIIALTTYVKQRPSEAKGRGSDTLGSYRLYALGADSLAPLSQEFVDKHALKRTKVAAQADGSGGDDNIGRSSGSPDEKSPAAEDVLAINGYAYLEERLFSLKVDERTVRVDLDYLPFRISQDVATGMPPVLLVAGNDNRVHRYALGSNGIVEIEPLLCPKTDVALTFTAFDARVIGPYHVQITAHQEFAVALQASCAEDSGESAAQGQQRRRLLIADEEVYDAAPILTTIFTPEANQVDRTAYDYVVTHRVSSSPSSSTGTGTREALVAGDVYDSEWPIGTTGREEPSQPSQPNQQMPRVHALIGFVGEDAIVYHDVAVAGLDPVPTLVGGVSCRVPATAPHIAGRLGGRGGVFSLPGSSREGVITSVHFDDLDYNGTKEIIVGTVSGAVLIYKEVAERGYALVWKRRFPAPAYAIFSVDINCDGANELMVVTLLGVHIMQPNLSLARAKLLRQLIVKGGSKGSGSGSE